MKHSYTLKTLDVINLSNNINKNVDDKPIETIDTTKNCRFWGSVRMTYMWCAFVAMILHIYMRTAINFIILCMVKHNATENAFRNANGIDQIDNYCGSFNSVSTTNQNIRTGDLEWTRSQEFSLQGIFYYGYVIILPFAGQLADRLGGKFLFVHSITGQAILFLLMPLCAGVSYIAMMIALFVQGMVAGCGNPAIYQLFSIWAHPTERTATVSFAFGGFSLGTVLAFPISSFLCQYGWYFAFYSIGLVALVIGISFHWLVYSTLDDHPRLSRKEYDYLKAANVEKKKHKHTPWKKILTSVPIYAYTFTHIFHSYGLIVFIIMIPRYFNEAIRFPIDQVGILSSAPFLGSFISKMVTIATCSVWEKKSNVNMSMLRKIVYVTCNCISILCIWGMITVDCTHKFEIIIFAIIVIVVSDFAFSGTYFPSLLHLAPAYSGVISGISNCLATTSGFSAPILISFIVKQGSKTEWDYIMMSLMASYGLGALIYGTFGSSKLQEWGQGE